MDPGTALSIVQTCYTVGTRVVEICTSWRNADVEVRERVVKVENSWYRSKRQVDFMIRINAIIDEELRRLFKDLMDQLWSRLSDAITMLSSVSERGNEAGFGFFRFGSRAKKAAYLRKKDALDQVIGQLEEWQGRFDPTWFLVLRIADPIIDSELKKAKANAGAVEAVSQRLPTAARNPLALATNIRNALSPDAKPPKDIFLPVFPMETIDIPYSDVKVARRRTGDPRWYVVDTIECGPDTNVKALSQDVCVLAAKLAQADPLAFGLLSCKGAMRVLQHGSSAVSCFKLVFRFPDGVEVLQSLRQLLLNSDANISLTRKMRIARELAKSVSYVHTFNFVHKNVRPESIVYFENPQATHAHTCLVGFDAFRAADGGTLMHGDMLWERNVYRHPRRQGDNPLDKYKMQHDIYSLGVCLLEIGLWESFVEYYTTPGGGTLDKPRTVLGKTSRHFETWLAAAQKTSEDGGEAPKPLAFKLKDYLVEQAQTRLAPRMGDTYAQVVVSCLTCLDDENDDVETATDDFQVAVQFIGNIMMCLDKISV
ncbi:hypothetical protein QBC46DRAFT_387699 [Diplogelasinospora grovesii]|uniref:Protein kinase domain-containing protein n=1 Tax=Diplogelasinospora grovesii TaxID=303347 RepID=A0AAN6S397_9PEZI|nr:hypothetical protein QBC46DRAFT_387699 [Diplogelasinospora grovesii]